MKKTMHLILAGACIFALAGGAAAAKARTATGEYNTLTVDTGDPGPITAGQFSNGVIFEVKPGERWVSVVLDDEAAENVRAIVTQDYDGDGASDMKTEICTASESPIRIRPGVDLEVWAQEGVCNDGSPSPATFGTVTATFTR